jgi:2,3-diketo-5-methylthio-1-phosphopentane phosphatase
MPDFWHCNCFCLVNEDPYSALNLQHWNNGDSLMLEHTFFDIFGSDDQPENPWSIICDFDGTVTPFDVTDALLREFAPSSWEKVEKEWLAGKITARQCMEKQISMIRAPVSKLDGFLDGLSLTEGFGEFAYLCRAHSLPLLIVSDGLDYAIKRILGLHGLLWIPVVANRLLCGERGAYGLQFPYSNGECPSGVCKCSVAASAGGKTLLIGDGRSDCCLAGSADFILAKEGEALERHCVRHGYPHDVFVNFRDLRAGFEEIPRPLGTAEFSHMEDILY